MPVPIRLTEGTTITFTTGRALKNGESWDLTGADSVVLELKNPSGEITQYTATVNDDGDGTYTIPVDELTPTGMWRERWHVVKGAIDARSFWIPFEVV